MPESRAPKTSTPERPRRLRRTLVRALIVGLLAIAGGFGVHGCAASGTTAKGDRLSRMQASPHYDAAAGVFRNRRSFDVGVPRGRGGRFATMKRFFFGDAVTRPPAPLPQEQPDLAAFAAAPFAAIWLGHSSFLLRVGGKTLLFDPVLSGYASPVPGVIPRFQPPVLSAEQLPPVDAVVISHDHYDHLDMETIETLAKGSARFFVPLGVGAHLEGWGIARDRITELDWWQDAAVGAVQLTLTPAQHFSGRGISDRNATLWGSWVVRADGKRVFFSGDGGYDQHFAEIGKRLGPFDAVFLENGQYSEDWPNVHLLPRQGVRAFTELGGKRLIPVHWGMFDLSTHNWWDPIESITALAYEHALPLMTPKIGQLIDLDAAPKVVPWWRSLMPVAAVDRT